MPSLEQMHFALKIYKTSIDDLAILYESNNLDGDEELMLAEYLDVLINFKKSNDIPLSTILNHLTENKKTIQIITHIVETSLIRYDKTMLLRTIERRNKYLVKSFLTDAFHSYITRYDPTFIIHYDKYSLHSYIEMKDVLENLKSMIYFYISKSFVKSHVITNLKRDTGLSDELTHHIGELYELHYNSLKQNYILSKMEMIDNAINELLNNKS